MKTFKVFTAWLTVLICLSLTTTACSDDDDDENGDVTTASLVGTWQYTVKDYYIETVTFNSDGTFKTTVKTDVNDNEITASETGTYRYEKNIITMSVNGVDIYFRVKSITSKSLTIELITEESETEPVTYQKV